MLMLLSINIPHLWQRCVLPEIHHPVRWDADVVGTVDVVVVVGHGQRGTAHRTGAAVKEAPTRCGNTAMTSSPAGSFTHGRVCFSKHIFHSCFPVEAILSSGPNLSRTVLRSQLQTPEQPQGTEVAPKATACFHLSCSWKQEHTSGHAGDASTEDRV